MKFGRTNPQAEGTESPAAHAAFAAECDAYFARVRRAGEERAAQDRHLLGFTLDPENDYASKAARWRAGYAAEAARLARR